MSSSSSSGSDDGQDHPTSTRRLQFGETQDIEPSDSSTNLNNEEVVPSESYENVNARLRHLMPQSEQSLRPKLFFKENMGALIIVTLEQCLQKLMMMREMNRIPFTDISLEYIPLNEKYQSDEHDIERLMHDDEDFFIAKKFAKDLCWLEKVVQVSLADFKDSFYFGLMLKILRDYEVSTGDEKMLLKSKEFNKKELQKIRIYIEEEKITMTKNIQKITEALGNAKDELNDNIVESKVKIHYVREWENSRNEQNKAILAKKENGYIETSKNMNEKAESETRVHSEMINFLQSSLSEYTEDIDLWMHKYDKDLEGKEHEIQSLKFDVDRLKEKHARLVDEYNKREEEMEAYKAHKIRRQKEEEELERKISAAIKIQSWWRGIMFRKGLGPYRKKRKGRKGSGKKGSGKKSKSGTPKSSAKNKR